MGVFHQSSWARAAMLALGGSGLSFSPAFAHHPNDGAMPVSALEGLLSGIGHPILGLDHLAFVVAVGVAAYLCGRTLILPLAFVAATAFGTLIHVGSIGLPLVETVIALSVLLLGAWIAIGRGLAAPAIALAFAIAGVFHGHAYGEAIVGAEATPLLAYLAGFSLIQWAIAVFAGSAVGVLARRADTFAPRLAGAAVFGAGALIVSEGALAALGLG